MFEAVCHSSSCTDLGLLRKTELRHIKGILISRAIGDIVIVQLSVVYGGILFSYAPTVSPQSRVENPHICRLYKSARYR